MTRDGFALVGALWLVVAIASASTVTWQQFRAHALLSQNLAEAVDARVAVDAGIVQTRNELRERVHQKGPLWVFESRQADPWHLTGEEILSGRLDRALYSARVRELDALLSINHASEADVAEFFEALGVASPTASTVAASILDWRDADDMHRGQGAEESWYRAKGHVTMPRNRPFASVSEMRHLRGMTPSIFRSVEPLVTTFGDGRVNLNSAPAPVIAALPGIGVRAARRIVAERERGRRYASVYDAIETLSIEDRRAAEDRLRDLVASTTFASERLLVDVTGTAVGGRIHEHASVLFVRHGDVVSQVWTYRGF